MFMAKTSSQEWLPLSQASKILGVHAATLRDWADQGIIASYHTAGGHRRFMKSDLLAFLEMRRGGKERRGLPALLDRALTHTQAEIVAEGPNQAWLAAFSPDARRRQRELGRRLLGVMI